MLKKEVFYTNLRKMTSSHSRIGAIKTTHTWDIFRWILAVNDAILSSTSSQPSPGPAKPEPNGQRDHN